MRFSLSGRVVAYLGSGERTNKPRTNKSQVLEPLLWRLCMIIGMLYWASRRNVTNLGLAKWPNKARTKET